ncbi:type II toxin-antitoxin system VapC family toxin [Prauserella shujinwangii]|uniref:type II toxin-antitoxin system VapC family toxin n=1 Tax=Prauserella shujinwangii TaxID=1453103 RepID=UPI000D06ED96|nr:type II toxin-antitoxin system VapC family toxin [Prauserella shujinwangii]
MEYVVLDTDVASLSFKGQLPSGLLAELAGKPVCITFVTFGELTQWAVMRQWGTRNRAALLHWLESVPVIPGGKEVAEVWGEISAHAKVRGRPRPQNDTWIAACSIIYELPLATLNIRDFADFAEHEGLQLVCQSAE